MAVRYNMAVGYNNIAVSYNHSDPLSDVPSHTLQVAAVQRLKCCTSRPQTWTCARVPPVPTCRSGAHLWKR